MRTGVLVAGDLSVGSKAQCGRLQVKVSRRGQLKCDGTRGEIRFRLSAKRTSPFKSSRALVQSTTGSRGVRISGSNAGYTMFRGSVKSTGYPLHSPVSPSLPHACVNVCHHISTGAYLPTTRRHVEEAEVQLHSEDIKELKYLRTRQRNQNCGNNCCWLAVCIVVVVLCVLL